VVLHRGAHAGVAGERQRAVSAQRQRAVLGRQRVEVRLADAAGDLPLEVGGAVVRRANVDRAAVARDAGALREQVAFLDPVAAGRDRLAGLVIGPTVGAGVGQVVPSDFV